MESSRTNCNSKKIASKILEQIELQFALGLGDLVFYYKVRSKILFNKKCPDFVETFTYFYQIAYPKNVNV